MGYEGDKKRAYQNEWVQKRRTEWIASEGGCCAKCGSTNSLQVDHIDPASKCVNPSGIWSLSAIKRYEELAKCQVLCKPCHVDKTSKQFTIEHEYGNVSRYDKGCHCQLCRDAKAESMRQSRARRAAG